MSDKSIEDSIAYVLSQDINYGDSESFLTFNQERYPEYNNPEDDKITADLSELYKTMNGKSHKGIDKI